LISLPDRFYVFGGDANPEGPGELHRDFWYLDLQKMDKWRRLPDYPVHRLLSPFTGYSNIEMAVHEDKAYLFLGTLSVDYFDLKKNQWGVLQTLWTERGR